MPATPDADAYLQQWNLTPDGPEIVTPRARLLPVRRDGAPAMLKVLSALSDEANAPRALRHFAGRGAVRVLAEADRAVLLERAVPGSTLTDLVAGGRDDEATAIIADIAGDLHHGDPPEGFVGVEQWADGFHRQRERGPHPVLPPAMLDRAETLYRDLAASQARRFLLHGDLHHENILLGERGWLVIDPKGVVGEAAFEVVMSLGNPHPTWPFPADRKVMARRVAIFSERLAPRPRPHPQLGVRANGAVRLLARRGWQPGCRRRPQSRGGGRSGVAALALHVDPVHTNSAP